MIVTALRFREDYANVLRRGAVHYTRYFTFRTVDRNALQMRLAIVVSKKVSAKATARNLLRRRIRECLRRSEGATRGRDIIIQVKQEAAKLSRKELYEQLVQAMGMMERKER